MHIGNYLGLVHESEQQLAKAFQQIAKHHGDEPDICQTCMLLSSWSEAHVKTLKPFVDRYLKKKHEPERLSQSLFEEPRSGSSGSLALLRDLHDLWLITNEVHLRWVVILQAAKALRDLELEDLCQQLDQQSHRQQAWLLTRIKQAAPQILVVAA